MGKAVPYAVRELIVKRRQAGESPRVLALELNLSYDVVCKIWRGFRKQGQQALVPQYARCGRKPGYSEDLKSKINTIREHEGGRKLGAPYIRSKLLSSGQYSKFPHERTIQRWFRAAGQNRPVGRGPKHDPTYSVLVHETWQVDAKENLVLADGSEVCYVNCTDEASGTFLHGEVFPPLEG